MAEVTFKLNLRVDGKDVIQRLTVDAEELRSALGETKAQTEQTAASFLRFNQATEFVRNLSDSVSQVSSVLSSLTAESRGFGAAMAAANTMAGKGGEEFAQMKEQVSELSHVIPIARDELANGLYQVISNGVPEGNWMQYLEQSAKASVGGIADLGETVKVTSTIIKNYGLDWSDALAVQDKIQLTAKYGVTSFEQLAQALPRVTSNAATLGVSINELMAIFSTLTGVSGNTAEVSTQLAAVFTALVKPSSEATQMAQEMGIQFDAAAIKAAGGMSQFLTSLDKSVKEYSAASGVLEQEVYGRLFGSAESLRALVPLQGELADKFQENVAAMQDSEGTIDEAFATMASTGSSTLQMLNNKLGEYTDILQGSIGNVTPYLNFTAQVLVAGSSTLTLARSVNTMGAMTKLSSAAVAAFGPIVQVCSATMRGAAVSAETLRLAIRGLMITTGIGIAVAALTEAVNYLAKSCDDAAGSVDTLSEAETRAKAAHQQAEQQMVAVRSEMDANIAKLKDFHGSKEQERTIVQQINAKYGEAMGYYSSVAQWYTALTTNSKAYCSQMINEIRLRQLANQAANLQQQQREIKYNDDGTARKYSTKNKTKSVTTGQVDAGDGKVIPIKQEVEVKGTSQLDEANRKLTALYQQEKNVRKEMQRLVEEGNKLNIKHTEGYSPTMPTTTTAPSSGKGGKNTTSSSASATPKDDPLQGSIDWYNKTINDKKRELEASASDATRIQLQGEIEGLERELGMLKVKIGIDKVPPVEVKKETTNVIDELDAQMEDFLGKYKDSPIVIDTEINAKAKDIENIKSLFSININDFSSVQGALANIKNLSGGTAQGLAAAGASCQMMGSAIQQLGANSAAAKAGMVLAAIGQLTLSFAMAMTSAATNWVTWLALGISGTATLINIISTIAGFATGGIVGGNSTSGDKLLVRVNSGEMILNAAQQARLFALANGTATYGASAQVASDFASGSALPVVDVQSDRLSNALADTGSKTEAVRWRIRGRDIVASVANETRSNRKRSNIRLS